MEAPFLAFSSRSLLNSPIRASREEPLHWLSRFVSSYPPAPDSNQRLLALQTKLLIIAQWRTCNAHLLSREVSFFTRISIHPCILMIVITINLKFVSFLPLYSFTYVEVLFKAAKVLTCERPSPRELPNRRREIEKLPNQKSQFYTFSFNELLYLTPQLF